MVVAAGIGAAATIVGAGAQISAGNKAAKAQAQGAQTAADASERATQAQIAESRRQYDQTRADYAPYREAGYGALGKLAGMYGVAPTNADGTPGTVASSMGLGYSGNGGFTASPGYQFRMDEGLKAIDRQNSARGVLNSGGADKSRMRYAQGLASTEYDTFANRIAALAGVGQSATGSTAQAGANASGQIVGALSNNGTNQYNSAMTAGNARASSYANTGAAISGATNSLAGLYFNGAFGGGNRNPYGISGAGGIY